MSADGNGILIDQFLCEVLIVLCVLFVLCVFFSNEEFN